MKTSFNQPAEESVSFFELESGIDFERAPVPSRPVEPMQTVFTAIPRLESVTAEEYHQQYEEMKKAMPKNHAYAQRFSTGRSSRSSRAARSARMEAADAVAEEETMTAAAEPLESAEARSFEPSVAEQPSAPVSAWPEEQPSAPVSAWPEEQPSAPVSAWPEEQPSAPVSAWSEEQPPAPVSAWPEEQPSAPVSAWPEEQPSAPVSAWPEEQPPAPVSAWPEEQPSAAWNSREEVETTAPAAEAPVLSDSGSAAPMDEEPATAQEDSGFAFYTGYDPSEEEEALLAADTKPAKKRGGSFAARFKRTLSKFFSPDPPYDEE